MFLNTQAVHFKCYWVSGNRSYRDTKPIHHQGPTQPAEILLLVSTVSSERPSGRHSCVDGGGFPLLDGLIISLHGVSLPLPAVLMCKLFHSPRGPRLRRDTPALRPVGALLSWLCCGHSCCYLVAKSALCAH